MKRPTWQISAIVAVLCGAILVLFTNVELRLLRWVNCGPLLDARSRASDACR